MSTQTRSPALAPFKDGVSRFEGLDLTEAQREFTDKLSKAATLADLAKEYVLFNHSALFIYTGMGFDPLAMYAAMTKECAPALVQSECHEQY